MSQSKSDDSSAIDMDLIYEELIKLRNLIEADSFRRDLKIKNRIALDRALKSLNKILGDEIPF